MRLFRWTVVGLLAGFAIACGDAGVAPPPPLGPRDSLVNAVVVAPDHVSLTPGQTKTLAASVVAGRYVTERNVEWTSSDTMIVTVSIAGIVTGRAPGHATVAATSRADHAVQGTSAIEVVAPDTLR